MHHRIFSLLATAAIAVGAQAQPAAPAKPVVTVIHAGHLIAVLGRVRRERQSIVIENGKIKAIENGYVSGDKVIDLTDRWVLPGFIDMHTHVSMDLDINSANPGGSIALAYVGRPAEEVLATIPKAQAVMRNGFTTIRNLGDPASVTYALGNAINAGIVAGPRLIASEPQFGVVGGDYDASQFGERYELEPLMRSRGTCSGVTECVKVTREEIRRGAGVIKLRLSAFAALDPKSKPMETPEEMRAIVDTAHRLDRRVAVHSIGNGPANQIAIEAGVDTIEHGPLSDQNIKTMKKLGTGFTPTLMAAKIAADSPMAKEVPALANYYKEAVESVKKAYKAGIPIVFGTDLPVTPIARENEEFLRLHEAGLSPVDVLKSATTTAAKELGMADNLGSIAPGKAADIVAVPDNPLADVTQLTHVDYVMKDGKTFFDAKAK